MKEFIKTNIEITKFDCQDVITTSGAFDGEIDPAFMDDENA